MLEMRHFSNSKGFLPTYYQDIFDKCNTIKTEQLIIQIYLYLNYYIIERV